jgi:hypothetical protein
MCLTQLSWSGEALWVLHCYQLCLHSASSAFVAFPQWLCPWNLRPLTPRNAAIETKSYDRYIAYRSVLLMLSDIMEFLEVCLPMGKRQLQ